MASIISDAGAVAEFDHPERLTEAERAYCERSRRRRAERVAARVLAKRLLLNELGLSRGAETPWQDVEFYHDERGAPEVGLSGTAQEAARHRGAMEMTVSWSHTDELVTVALSV